MTMPAIAYQGVTMRFDQKTVLDSVSLSVADGEYCVLLGPSGGGKTTLLNLAGGFLKPDEGRVMINGSDMTDIPAAKRPTTTVFQDYALFPHMTIADNVGFGLRMRGIGKAERRAKAMDMLALVGLPDSGARKPHELSGGQRQRIALARALVVNPSVLLLDEPLGALDLKLRQQMQAELKAIQRRIGTTFLHVTHDQEEAMAVGDRIVVMNEGRIEDEGTPERVYLRPASRFSALFMGENNLIDGTVSSHDTGTQSVTVETKLGPLTVPGMAEVGSTVALAIRPEHLTIADDCNGAITLGHGNAQEIAFFATHHQGSVRLSESGITLRVRLPQVLDAVRTDHPLTLKAHPSNFVLLTRKVVDS